MPFDVTKTVSIRLDPETIAERIRAYVEANRRQLSMAEPDGLRWGTL